MKLILIKLSSALRVKHSSINNMLKSATKFVLIMFSFTVCIGFLLGKIQADIFIATSTLVLGAYFGNKAAPAETIPPVLG